jgi:hypothetical protein
MNLPKYVAAIENAHSEYRIDANTAAKTYQISMSRATEKLEATLNEIKNEFFDTEDVPMETDAKPQHEKRLK